jgi:CSLREA domain-containing protein
VSDGNGVDGPRIDIGAYERQSLLGLNLVVDTLVDESDGNYSAGDLSLREAIGLANESAGTSTITFAAVLTSSGPATILLTMGELWIQLHDTLTIDGPGANLLTIDASGNDPTPTIDEENGSRVFLISDAGDTRANVSISGVTLTGADNLGAGGAITQY